MSIYIYIYYTLRSVETAPLSPVETLGILHLEAGCADKTLSGGVSILRSVSNSVKSIRVKDVDGLLKGFDSKTMLGM